VCYSGDCYYEDHTGECIVHYKDKFPEDASCVMAEKEIEKQNKEKRADSEEQE
jgi:hypothetical protein